ncbi:MAG: polysaccharide lyase family 7 protein [Methylotenera sp.]|nr:polysaccharide lyase family 7 protein [Oligoflexia bacterium]
MRNPPSRFFSLAGWKLTLPVDSFGGTGGTGGIQFPATTLISSQLTSEFVDDFFYADGAGKLVFSAPSNGAVTTPGSGSDHTRSELREIYTGLGADTNNDWNSAIGGTLGASCSVQSVAVNASEATIGQIHNQSVAFALLIYRPAQRDIALSLYTTLTSGIAQRTSLIGNVGLNDTITYSLVYSGNTLTTTVNGVTRNFTPDTSWTGTPMYFKVGAYHSAPNTGNPVGDTTRVTFTSFNVSH